MANSGSQPLDSQIFVDCLGRDRDHLIVMSARENISICLLHQGYDQKRVESFLDQYSGLQPMERSATQARIPWLLSS